MFVSPFGHNVAAKHEDIWAIAKNLDQIFVRT